MPAKGATLVRNLTFAVLLQAVLVGCASPVVSPPASGSIESSPSLRPSDDASPMPSRTSGPSGPAATATPSAGNMVGVWHAGPSMIAPHAFHRAVLLHDGRVLVAGGVINDRIDGQVSAAAELFDRTGPSWTATTEMIEARFGHAATVLRDGKVLVAGSYVSNGFPLPSAELYDPTSGRWTPTGSMTTGRGGHAAILLPDGRVLVVGGGDEDTSFEGGPRSSSAELYDPATGTWTKTRSMNEVRKGFTATLLPDGRVLVAGGDPGYTAAELYDPSTSRWTATGSMADGRFSHTATLLGDGSVLVTGGCACSEPGAITSAELYDPRSGEWTPTADMGTARIGHTATLLADGTVLVIGGEPGEPGDRPTTAELFDPETGRWAVTTSPARARDGYTLTLLADGTVLLAGDYDYESAATTELYKPGGGS